MGYGTNAGFLRSKIRLAGEGSRGIYSPRPAAAPLPVSAFLPFSLAVGHSRFPALANRTFHVLGLLEDSNQRNKLFFCERVVINSKCCKVRADFLFLGAALKMYSFQQLLLHSGSGQVIIRGQSIRSMFLTDVPQDIAQIIRNKMPEIFFLLYLRCFQGIWRYRSSASSPCSIRTIWRVASRTVFISLIRISAIRST